MDEPKVAIVVVDSRSIERPDWYNQCIASIQEQYYKNYDLIVADNKQKLFTVGCKRNEAVKSTKEEHKWILFVDDDDFITQDYLLSLVKFVEDKGGEDVVGITSHTTFFYSDGKTYPVEKAPIGMWRRDWLLENLFNEHMMRYEDVDLLQRTINKGKKNITIKWHFGYYYRQHQTQNSRINELKEVTHETNSKLVKRDVNTTNES